MGEEVISATVIIQFNSSVDLTAWDDLNLRWSKIWHLLSLFPFQHILQSLISAPCLTSDNCYTLIWMTPYVRFNASPCFRILYYILYAVCCSVVAATEQQQVFPCRFKGTVLRNKQIWFCWELNERMNITVILPTYVVRADRWLA